jgi:integrase
MIDGIRYRPTIRRPPSESNLRRARERLALIKRQIEVGTFSFSEEFPDYRYLHQIVGSARVRSCDHVFDEFLAHCEARVAHNDMAHVTWRSYQRILNKIWRPALGKLIFSQVRYSHLLRVVTRAGWSRKTHNNVISVIRRAFEFGYRDHPEHPNPALGLHVIRLKRKDRPRIDPFNIQDAESLIAALHRDWVDVHGNYDESRFFTGLRPSEQIALVLSDVNLEQGSISINKACVAGVYRDCAKTAEDRRLFLCPRARDVLKDHLELRARWARAGRIQHEHVFFQGSGEPIRNLNVVYVRWRKTLRAMQLRYRKPYCARHSSVSWNLMIGKNPLWVAKQHGHNITTMLRAYSAWAEGAVEEDVEAIRRAMQRRPSACAQSLPMLDLSPPRALPLC